MKEKGFVVEMTGDPAPWELERTAWLFSETLLLQNPPVNVHLEEAKKMIENANRDGIVLIFSLSDPSHSLPPSTEPQPEKDEMRQEKNTPGDFSEGGNLLSEEEYNPVGMLWARPPHPVDMSTRKGWKGKRKGGPPGGFAKSWEIAFIGVLEKYQRRGIATLLLHALVSKIIEAAPEGEDSSLSLWTNLTEDDYRVLGFYKKFNPRTFGYSTHPHPKAAERGRRLKYIWMSIEDVKNALGMNRTHPTDHITMSTTPRISTTHRLQINHK